MKHLTHFASLCLVSAGFGILPQNAGAIQFDLSSLTGSEIIFTGGGPGTAGVTFSPGDNFKIDTVFGGTGSAEGYVGSFSGSWSMGPVTTINLSPLVETAPVTGVGALTIDDGVDVLTASLDWVESKSLQTIISIANLGVTANVTGVSYSGTDPDLLAFVAGLDQTAILSFSFPPPGQSLAELVAGGVQGTIFSGNIVASGKPEVVPDSGVTIGLLGLGLGAVAAVKRWTQTP